MNLQAIILAGGLGTRLSETVPGIPKCMAPVAGRPFLFYVINYLRMQGIHEFIFSLGYRHEMIEEYLSSEFKNLRYKTVIEKEPLGTGGAIQLSLRSASSENVVIANGDTVFKIDLDKFFEFHLKTNSECTLALKPMKDFDRYGVVELNEEGRIEKFREKQFYASGLINGGLYILQREKFLSKGFPEKFSFEKDYLEKQNGGIYGYTEDAYFIDIGVPQDYFRSQEDFARPVPDLSEIDKQWTLFIDRDGVINYEKNQDYIRNWNEFKFYENVPETFKNLSEKFGKVIVVSNQRGVGKKLMTEDDLCGIHDEMVKAINKQGGHIDQIYYCTSLFDDHPERKPNPGMALRARRDFPGIDFNRSIMLGNKLSDMRFGKNAGMYTVFIATTHPDTAFPHPDIDLRFNTLDEFVKAL